MSSQRCIFDDDGFSQRLLRPWSFASLGSNRRSSLLEESCGISEENYALPRQRRKSLGAWAQYSSTTRENPTPEEPFAVGEKGWWDRQMLVDRSLRSMAALTTIFAIIMISVCCTFMHDFTHRKNLHSTSVGFEKPKDCRTTEKLNLVSCNASDALNAFQWSFFWPLAGIGTIFSCAISHLLNRSGVHVYRSLLHMIDLLIIRMKLSYWSFI